jgi:hypothetical protein
MNLQANTYGGWTSGTLNASLDNFSIQADYLPFGRIISVYPLLLLTD